MEEKNIGVLTDELYIKETEMCSKLHSKKGGCLWGKCSECGVIPLLYKLKTGELLHGEEAERLKENIFKNKKNANESTSSN